MHHDFDPERFIAAPPRTEDAYASFIGRQIGESSVVLLVAERDGEVLGYAYAGVEGPDYMSLRGPAGVLYDIVVDPNHRGHGVGRLLLEAILAALKARGAPRVVVSTAEQNEAAQRLCRLRRSAHLEPANRNRQTGSFCPRPWLHGNARNSGPPEIRQEMIALSQAAVDRGVTFSIRRRPGTSPKCVKRLNSRSNPIHILRYRYSTASARARLVVT
jgi:GNAT superfamily N-acetyltransferase